MGLKAADQEREMLQSLERLASNLLNHISKRYGLVNQYISDESIWIMSLCELCSTGRKHTNGLPAIKYTQCALKFCHLIGALMLCLFNLFPILDMYYSLALLLCSLSNR